MSCICSEFSARGLPPDPALGRGAFHSGLDPGLGWSALSHSARERSIWSMRREVGLSSLVSRPSARERMWMP